MQENTHTLSVSFPPSVLTWMTDAALGEPEEEEEEADGEEEEEEAAAPEGKEEEDYMWGKTENMCRVGIERGG